MRSLPCALMAVALAAVLSTSSAAQQPPVPVEDPTLPLTAPPAGGPPIELAVPTSLLQEAQPEVQDRFKPLDELPPEEQYPAAPLIITAYAFVMAALFVYLLSVARRLGTVKQDVERLERDVKKSGRA